MRLRRSISIRLLMVATVAAGLTVAGQRQASTSHVTLASASGCTGWGGDSKVFECIDVSGTLLRVRSVTGSALWTGGGTHCGYQVMTVNGYFYLSGPWQCIADGQTKGHTWNFVTAAEPNGRWFANYSKICTYLSGYSGTAACETVHN